MAIPFTLPSLFTPQQDVALNDLITPFNGWDLQSASYNGVQFFIVNKIQGIANKITNEAMQVINSANAQLSVFGVDIFPLNNTLLNNVGIGTQFILKSMNDDVKRKLVIHNTLNSNRNIIEDMGFGVETFSGIGILQGNDYYNAYVNIYNYFTSRKGDVLYGQIPSNYKNVLVHPVRGSIPNVYISRMNILHAYDKYKAIMFNFEFIAESIQANLDQKTSFINIFITDLNAIKATSNLINTSSLAIQTVFNNVRTLGFSSSPNVNIPNIQTYNAQVIPYITNTIVPLANSITKLIYNNYNQGYIDLYYNNFTIPSTLTSELHSYTIINNLTINSILSILNNDILNIINQINSLGLNTLAADTIQNLKQLYIDVLNLAQNVISNNSKLFFSYTTPYDTSLTQVLFINNLDFNDQNILQSVFNNNQITCTNYITQGTMLTLPRVI